VYATEIGCASCTTDWERWNDTKTQRNLNKACGELFIKVTEDNSENQKKKWREQKLKMRRVFLLAIQEGT
jgi:hypothetical protein